MSFYDQHRLRKGDIINYGWCGTCAIPQTRLQSLIADKHAELQAQGHTCLVLSDCKTLIWWCGEEESACNPLNYAERPFYATTLEQDGTHYVGLFPSIEIAPDDTKFKRLINSDVRHLALKLESNGHTCLEYGSNAEHVDSYQWCGSNVCTKPKSGEKVKMNFPF